MFSTDATMVDLTAWSCQQQRNSFSLNTFHPWLVEAMMWSLWMLGGADSIVNLYFQMCCVFAFQMNDCTTCSEFWHFGAKKLTTQLPHKLSPGPGGYLIIVTRGRVAWYRLKRKGQCVCLFACLFLKVPLLILMCHQVDENWFGLRVSLSFQCARGQFALSPELLTRKPGMVMGFLKAILIWTELLTLCSEGMCSQAPEMFQPL